MIDEWPVLMQPTGSRVDPCPKYTYHAAASVGLEQSSAADGTALVEEQDQQAIRALHLKPKRVDEDRS